MGASKDPPSLTVGERDAGSQRRALAVRYSTHRYDASGFSLYHKLCSRRHVATRNSGVFLHSRSAVFCGSARRSDPFARVSGGRRIQKPGLRRIHSAKTRPAEDSPVPLQQMRVCFLPQTSKEVGPDYKPGKPTRPDSVGSRISHPDRHRWGGVLCAGGAGELCSAERYPNYKLSAFSRSSPRHSTRARLCCKVNRIFQPKEVKGETVC